MLAAPPTINALSSLPQAAQQLYPHVSNLDSVYRTTATPTASKSLSLPRSPTSLETTYAVMLSSHETVSTHASYVCTASYHTTSCVTANGGI